MFCLKTQHIVPSQDLSPDHSIERTNHDSTVPPFEFKFLMYDPGTINVTYSLESHCCVIVQVEDELAREKENSAKLENSVTDLTSQCRISLQQMEEFRKEVKEKVSEWYRRFTKVPSTLHRRNLKTFFSL